MTADLAKLSPQQRTLLERRLGKRVAIGDDGIASVASHPRRETYPASFSQERLWFLNQMESDDASYNMSATLWGQGYLNISALNRSFLWVIERHESLRTRFEAVKEPLNFGSRVRQVIERPPNDALRVVDLSALDEGTKCKEMLREARVEAVRPFDLQASPLIRIALLRMSEAEHVLIVTVHHIIADAWSVTILVRELADAYEAFVNRTLPTVAPLTYQYGEFALRQREAFQASRLEELVRYWVQEIRGIAALDIRTDYGRPARLRSRGARVFSHVPQDTVVALNRFSVDHSGTLFMILLAGFQILLSRYSRQDRMLIGTTIAGRDRVEWEKVIGFFVNTVVLPGDTRGDPTVAELHERVKRSCLNAYTHQELPFGKLVEQCQPERDLSRHPLFQVMFVLQNAPAASPVFGDIVWRAIEEIEPVSTQFDIDLNVLPGHDGLRLVLEYNTDLFARETAEQLLRHYRCLLKQIADKPQSCIGQLRLLEAEETTQLLSIACGSIAPVPPGTVMDWIAAQALLTPEATAIVDDCAQMTYRELELTTRRIALALIKRGIGLENRVGVCMGHSTELVLAVIGVMRAGAAYVPLDPEYPRERLRQMIHDADPKLVICGRGCWNAEIVATTTVSQLVSEAEAPESFEDPRLHEQNAVYVIYTSGSAGRPKGVVVTHRSLANYIYYFGQSVVDGSDRVLLFSSPSFDISVEEMFGTLTRGATLIVSRRPIHLSAQVLFDEVCRAGVTILDLPTGVWHELMSATQAGSFQWPHTIRRVIIGGEAPHPAHVELWRERISASLVNTYGPTEATIACTRVDLADSDLSIGMPVQNAQVHVLDEELGPVPIGVQGEICIAGTPVSRGYLNQPEWTAERFLPNPFALTPGERLYRSGDLARVRRDGLLEYIGRSDDQAKVRGFRVEPAEIENVLLQHSSIVQGAVTIDRDYQAGPRLIAYLVTRSKGSLTSDEIRRWLVKRLPRYMVPSVFVFLDCLPIGPNGKLCRADLPAPDYTLQANDTLVVHARNEIEARVCAVWRDLLGKESIGIRDNFFDLGGHSLLVIELQRRLEDVFDRKVPVVEIFGNPTIEGLSTFFAPFESDITPSTVESRAEKQRRALADVAAARRRNRGTTAPVSR